jgi:signal transduction histidine kinase
MIRTEEAGVREQTRIGRLHRREVWSPRAHTCAAMADAWPRQRTRAPMEVHLRRQLTALEAENRHLQAVNHRQTTVVAHVAHELRTPLTAIIGSLALVLEGPVGPVAGRQREWLDLARRHGARLGDLIEDLLDLARLHAGRAELKRRALDLVCLIEEVVQVLRPQLGAKGQHLALEIDQPLPVVSGDAARIIQILTNLLTNAHTYTPPGGTITVRIRGEASHVRVEVQDTGIGLCPGDLAQLFTPSSGPSIPPPRPWGAPDSG